MSAGRAFRVALLVGSLLAAAIGLSGCAGGLNAGSGLRATPQDAQRLGDQLHPDLVAQFGGRYDHARLSALVSQTGARLAASLASDPAAAGRTPSRWTFTVLDSPVPNAFALPGGYIYVTRGLVPFLADVDALAAAMAHEMGHVTENHYLQRLEASRRGIDAAISAGREAARAGAGRAAQTEAAAMAWIDYVASFSRVQELEADRLSVRALARAGYDPLAQASLIESLQAIEAYEAEALGAELGTDAVESYSLHPSSAERLTFAVAEARQRPGAGVRDPQEARASADRLLDAVDGVRFGDSPEDGVIRGAAYLNARTGVRFSVPETFLLTRSADTVIAIAENGPAITYFGGEESYEGPLTRLLQEISDEAAADGDAPLETIAGFEVNGLDAASATAREIPELPSFEATIVAIRVDGLIHFFVAFYPADAARAAEAPIGETIASFRRLSPAERTALRPARIQVVRVGPTDSVAGFARRMTFYGAPEALFRALNGLGAGERPTPGRRVKILTDSPR